VLGLTTRSVGWHYTHAAAGYAAAGDTARLARLADSVEAIGALGAFGRDRRLHHHLRGLLWVARGRREEAAASFRRAIYAPTNGYTRTNLELGRTLLALGRPREAAAALAPALHGDVQSSNYYVTHAELHEALAQAHEAAGERDSARVHYAWVANAWRRGDPPFRERAARARAKAR
jgi:predicted Zn-dependent protease